MIAVPPTRELLLTYLQVCDGPRHITRICAYMQIMHRVRPGTTRTMLMRLTRAHAITHLPNHYYQGAPHAAEVTE